MNSWQLVGAIALFFLSSLSRGELLTSDPDTVCAWLSEHGLKGRKWSKSYSDQWGCGSNYLELSGTRLPKNNLAYYVKGTRDAASEVKLMLNVNDRSTEANARHALLVKSQALAISAAGEKLPQSVSEAILEGLYWSQQVGGTLVRVNKVDWDTGKGYEIVVTFE